MIKIARNRDEELDLLQKRVVIDLVEFERKVAKKLFAAASNHRKDRKLNYGSSSRSRKGEYEYYKDCDEDLEEKPSMSMMMMKKKQKPTKEATSTKPSAPSIRYPPPELPKEFKEKIACLNGYQVQLVIQKKLFKTDLSSGHDRLSMPVNQVINKNFLGKDDERLNDNGFLYVKVLDPCLKVHDNLGLTKWKAHNNNNFSYSLNRGWNSISTDEEVGFKIGDTIQVWFFRVNDPELAKKDSIHFAVVKLKNDFNGSTSTIDRQEAAESSMTKKDEEEKKYGNDCSSSCSVSASQEVIESSTTKKQLEFGATRQHVSIKFRSVTLAKIETAVSVL
ncbi:B3 domain-containing protein [Pyrus ussuriensis x Pyrus communis]|uniref:B3 domain-containing protein n=1 Tax=Pyrus ussuriensis x Pyrus communis TaxID=2448454 RepID=A0A5N5HM76_9ROSA|nr:B3 domain-containing protein [Pyrus ussuriensis x Pyrus communis]